MIPYVLYFCLVTVFALYHCPKSGQHCFTSLEINYGFTRRTTLLKSSGHKIQDIDDVIIADGWNKTKLFINANGSLPGPDIM